METVPKEEEKFVQVSLDDLKLEIQEELRKIKDVKKTIRKLIKVNKIPQKLDYDEKIELNINSEYIKTKYSFQRVIEIDEIIIKEHLAHVFKVCFKESEILRNAIQKTEIGITSESRKWIRNLFDDLTNLNEIFGVLNENGSKNIMELTNYYLKEYNNPKSGKYKVLMNSNLSNDLKEFLCKLEEIEAESYTRVLLTKCGVHGITSTHSAEHFLKAFIKLHFERDSIRRYWNKDDIKYSSKEVLIKGLKLKFSSSNGFDDILFSMSKKGKYEKYCLKTVEMKVGNDLSSFFDYIRTNKNIKLTSQISNDIDNFLTQRLKQMIKNNVALEVANDIIVDLSNKYKFTTSGIGYDFNIKVKSGNLRNALIDAGLSHVNINQILEGAIKQNQIISLMQHGIAHQMLKKKGYYTTIDEIVLEVVLKTKIKVNDDERFVVTKIHRDVFLPKFVLGKNDKIILEIEGFGPVLQKMKIKGKHSTDEYKAILKLESIFKSALDDLNPCEIDGNTSANEIVRNLNEMHHLIYFEILKHCKEGLFKEFLIFENGQVSHCLETISNLGQKTKEQLLKNFKSKSIVPYTIHQHWETPFSLEKAFQLKGIKSDSSSFNGWLILKNMYIGNLLSNKTVELEDLDNVWNEFQEDSNWFQKILRDLPPPYKIPDGFNLNHLTHITRPIIFFDKLTMNPISVSGYNDKKQWLGIMLDINKFFEAKPSFSKNLFQFPIKINVRGVEFSQSDRIVEAWKKRLIYSGVPEEQVSLLGTQYNFRNAEGHFNIKILFAIIFEYEQIWNEFTSWIQENIRSVNDWSKFLPSSMDSNIGQRFRIENQQIQFDYTGKSDWNDVLLGIGSKQGEDTWNVRKENERTFVFPTQNNLFNMLVYDIRSRILDLIPETPHDIPVDEIWSFVVSNWNAL
ncbi:MAG: hypothetical protein H7641_02785 [Candidatus Heimdallarchaeota archaeon]|nr:hypothetical protein [Candidatus Heimdallarchaeota archaeon]MCK4876489.1 hypothetical protein [Candidatus Heimdallarchaeota archaeon]